MLSLEQLFCLVEFGKHWVKVGNNGCFGDLRAIGWAETGFFSKYFVTDRKNGKKPGFFGLDASTRIGFKADRPYSLKDVATLALMTEFYRHLRSQPIKALSAQKSSTGNDPQTNCSKRRSIAGNWKRDRPYSIGTSSKFWFLSPEVLGRIYNNWQSLVIGDICRETARRSLRRRE